MNIDEALQIAVDAHAGQIDIGGEPYILHPIRVMLKMHDYSVTPVIAFKVFQPSLCNPKANIFLAAFTSRSRTKPQLGQSCIRSPNSLKTLYPQVLQSWEV